MKTPESEITDEKRHEPRVLERVGVIVRVISAPGVPALEGRVFQTNSVDISVHGMQLFVEIPVPAGSEVKLEILFGDSTESHVLNGMVMWDAELGDAATTGWMHNIGINFRMDEAGIVPWVEAVQRLYAHHKLI